MKLALSLSASVLALGCWSAAHAQTADTNSDSSKTGVAKGQIETVVVTGERRTEDLMTTPITASVLSGDDLQARDITNVNGLQFIAPNVTVNDLGQGVDFDIRGIGKGEHNTQTPVGVVTYRDGASTFPGYLTAEPYYDIKSVEVYRGPQGTFVGQNATGGAVFVTTNDPVLGGGYDGYVQSQYGNYNDVQLQGAVNIPITDDLAVRFSGFGERRDSFYTIIDRDPADNCPGFKYVGCKPSYKNADLNEAAGRVSVLWQPTEALKVSLKYDALYQDFGAALAVPYSQLLPVGAPVQPFAAFGYTNPYHDSSLYHITSNAPDGRLDQEQRVILNASYTFADGTRLQSISDWNRGVGQWRSDLDLTDYGNPTDFPYFGTTNNWLFYDAVDETVVSQEFDLVSPENQPVTWVGGVYFQENDYGWRDPYQFWITVGPRFPNPTPNAANFFQYGSYTFQGTTTNLDIAAFGQVEAKLGNGFSASFGGRWTETRSHNNVDLWNYGNGYNPITNPNPSVIDDDQLQASSHFTYKAALDWASDEGDFLYAFVATGYTGGGLNTFDDAKGGPAPFNPVTDTDYEIGWKRNSWFDGHLRTEVDAFYTTYDHFQVTLARPSAPNTTYEINLPNTTKIYGLEGEAQANFGKFSFTANVGLLKSELGDFWAVDPRYGIVANFFYPGSTHTCDPLKGPSLPDPYCVNVKGNPMTYAPSFTYNLSAQYIFDLGNGDTFTPRANFAHVSGQWASIFDDPAVGDRLGVRDLLGAQLEYQRDNWLLTLYGDNLTDQQYVVSNNSGGLYAGLPRQFGIRLTKTF
ncbi:MAG TPA: TonB-dependent receptor [Rhizomicrobium sp.]|nr:TonB-dependent receptor [Rhizomicrobium sp.]